MDNRNNEIPKVYFKKNINAISEFEIKDLKEIYNKSEKLNFDIFNFHKQQFNVIFFIMKDNVSHFVDFESYILNKGDILFITNNSVHAFDKRAPIQGLVILFTDEFLLSSIARKVFKVPMIKNVANDKTISNFLDILKQEYDRAKIKEEIFYKNILSSLIIKLDTDIKEKNENNFNSNWYSVINLLDELIEKNNYRNRDVRIFAEEMGYGYKQLNIICKTLTGKTIKKYINDTVILEIKRKLITTDLSIKELCVYFNFDEDTNFIKFFKKEAGITPKKFKEKYLNKNF